MHLSWLLTKDSIYSRKHTASWQQAALYIWASAAEGRSHSLPKNSLVNLNIYVSWFHTSEERGNSMIYAFFQQASTSNFPSTSPLTVCQSERACVLVFVSVYTHVHTFRKSAIKQLMLAGFCHCEMEERLFDSPLATGKPLNVSFYRDVWNS